MRENIISIRLLDASGKIVDGFLVGTTGERNPESEEDTNWLEDDKDIDDLPPLTEREAEELHASLQAVFSEAMTVDDDQPVLAEHEQSIAQALVDYSSIALERPDMVRKAPLIEFIQMSPFQPVRIESAMEMVERSFGVITASSVKSVLASAKLLKSANFLAPPLTV